MARRPAPPPADEKVRDALPQPDPLRLRNREQLTEVVSAIVRDDLPIDDARIRALATPLVEPADLEQFIAMAISELSGLHEGNLALYRLRLSEFRRWRGRRDAPERQRPGGEHVEEPLRCPPTLSP